MRLWRRRRLLTQRQLAERAGLHVNAIQRIEVGDATPKISTMRKLSDALEVAPKDLFDLDEEEGWPP